MRGNSPSVRFNSPSLWWSSSRSCAPGELISRSAALRASDASRACAYCTANTGLSSVRFDQTLRSMSIGEAYDHRISA